MNEHDAIEQLAALLDRGDVENAEVPASLGNLVTLAATVREHADLVAPSADFRASLRAELIAAAAPTPGILERARVEWAARTAGLRASARVAVATMTASSMIGSAGVAVAAQEAMPGDLLYGVKAMTEDARMLLATDDLAEARLHLVFARERLEELRGTAGQLDADEVVALLAAMDAHSAAGAEALLDGVSAGALDASEVRTFASDQRNGITSVLHNLPLMAKPVAEDSLELLRRIEVNATGLVPAANCDCEPPSVLGARNQDATNRGARDQPRESTRSGEQVLSISAPGEGPALAELTCDCVEPPGGPDAREPAPTEDAAAAPEDGTDGTQEPEPEPFEPSGELTNPQPSNEDDGGDGGTNLDAPTSTERLLSDGATEPVDATVDSESTTDAVSRLEAGADDGLSGLLD